VPEPQDVDDRLSYFVADLVVPDDDAADLARLLLVELVTGKFPQAGSARGEALHDARGGTRVDGVEEIVQPRQV
jgi:hypothetical protein